MFAAHDQNRNLQTLHEVGAVGPAVEEQYSSDDGVDRLSEGQAAGPLDQLRIGTWGEEGRPVLGPSPAHPLRFSKRRAASRNSGSERWPVLAPTRTISRTGSGARRATPIAQEPPIELPTTTKGRDPTTTDVALRIDHVGSTAVPGLVAKPIIDLDIVVASDHDVRLVIEQLATIGYRWRGDLRVASHWQPDVDLP
jgi:hypothetical protein